MRSEADIKTVHRNLEAVLKSEATCMKAGPVMVGKFLNAVTILSWILELKDDGAFSELVDSLEAWAAVKRHLKN